MGVESSSLVYGIHAVETLLSTRLETIDRIYFDASKKSAPLFALIKRCRKERLAYSLVPALKLAQLAGTDKHQGVVAIRSVKPYTSPEELKKEIAAAPSPLFLVAASIEDPQNLGALIRSSVAFGVDALFLERKNTTPLSGVVAKTSAGTVEYCRILRPKNLEGILRGFSSEGFRIIGAMAGKGAPPERINLSGHVILILGGEHRGIPPYLEKLCSDFVSIPIDERVESLNVAAAGSVLLYECSRQRRIDGRHDKIGGETLRFPSPPHDASAFDTE